MLRVTVVDAPAEQTLILEGSLTGPDLSELISAWQTARVARRARVCIVDLRNATAIDHHAERILKDMKEDGVQFVACGVCTRYQLEQLGIHCI